MIVFFLMIAAFVVIVVTIILTAKEYDGPKYCSYCRYSNYVGSLMVCQHPSIPIDVVTGKSEIRACNYMRTRDKDWLSGGETCGKEGKFFGVRRFQ